MRKSRVMLAVAGAACWLAAFNRKLERSGGGSESGLGGEIRYWRRRDGDLAYYVAGDPSAEPLFLLHGIYAGASSFEFRKNFDELAKSFRVYALDLLGCGLSDRPRRSYAPEDVTAQIEEFVRQEIRNSAHLVASSLSAALAVPAAVRSPHLFRKLVLICPTGYTTLERPSGVLGDVIHTLVRAPVLGDSLYHAIVSKKGIRYYLERMVYHNPSLVTGDLVESYYRTAHGPGAKYLPAAFVAGKLNFGVADYWPRVPRRTLICWGREARTTPVRQIEDFIRRNPRAEPRIFKDSALLPHDERATDFNTEVREFLLQRSGANQPPAVTPKTRISGP